MFLYANNEVSKREIKKAITFNNSIKKNKTPRNKSNQGGIRAVYKKTLRHWCKKLKMTQTNKKIYHAHRLEELILWKWPYHPR